MNAKPMTLAEILEEIALGDDTGKGLGGQGVYAAIRWLVRRDLERHRGPETYCDICGLAILTEPKDIGEGLFVHVRCLTFRP